MALGKNIKELRRKNGLSQNQLSALTNGAVSQGAISALEKRDSASSEFAAEIAKALKVSVNQLITGVEPDNYFVLSKEEIEWLEMRKKLKVEDRQAVFNHGNSLAEQAKPKNNGTK